MIAVVDTNVAVVANGTSPQASDNCVLTCVQELLEITSGQVKLAVDAAWEILKEYMRHLSEAGQPGVGHAFLKWALTNNANPDRCVQVNITRTTGRRRYLEFPDDPRLAGFDPADRKFVAVAVAHPDHPPILQAVDMAWVPYAVCLAEHGVVIRFLCGEGGTSA